MMRPKVFAEFRSIVPHLDGTKPRVFIDVASIVAISDSPNGCAIYCSEEASWTVEGTVEEAFSTIERAIAALD